MKLITAIIQEDKLDHVREALKISTVAKRSFPI
jgi:nitrogen regulatory protein PII